MKLITKLKLDFFHTCGYRIECKFPDDQVINNDVVPVFYSKLYSSPKTRDTVSESRENFRTLLLANHIDIDQAEVYVITAEGEPQQHNIKVGTLRKNYSKKGAGELLMLDQHLREISDRLGEFALTQDMAQYQFVRQAIKELAAKL